MHLVSPHLRTCCNCIMSMKLSRGLVKGKRYSVTRSGFGPEGLDFSQAPGDADAAGIRGLLSCQ